MPMARARGPVRLNVTNACGGVAWYVAVCLAGAVSSRCLRYTPRLSRTGSCGFVLTVILTTNYYKVCACARAMPTCTRIRPWESAGWMAART